MMTSNSKLATLFMFLAACGANKPPQTPPNARAFEPLPEFAALFQQGRSWTYEYTVRSDRQDEEDPEAGEHGNVHRESTGRATCQVAETAAFEGARMSRIECDGLDGTGTANPLIGIWLIDSSGLYRPTIDSMPPPGNAPTALTRHRIVPLPPVEKQVETADPRNRGHVSTEEVHKTPEGWCWSETWIAGDEGSRSLCFGKEGVVSGGYSWAGGSSSEVTFGLVD